MLFDGAGPSGLVLGDNAAHDRLLALELGEGRNVRPFRLRAGIRWAQKSKSRADNRRGYPGEDAQGDQQQEISASRIGQPRLVWRILFSCLLRHICSRWKTAMDVNGSCNPEGIAAE